MVFSNRQVQDAVNAARLLLTQYGTNDATKKVLLDGYVASADADLDRAINDLILASEADNGAYIDPPPSYGGSSSSATATNADVQTSIQYALTAIAGYGSSNPLTGDSVNAYRDTASAFVQIALVKIQICKEIEDGTFVTPPPGYGL